MKTKNNKTQSDGNVTAGPDGKALPLPAASGCLRVHLLRSDNNLGLRTALNIGKDHCDNVRKLGGKARSLRSSDSVIIEQIGLTPDQSKSSIVQLISTSTLEVRVEERDSPEIDLESPGIIPGEFAWELLDREFLFGLPNYAIIIGGLDIWKPEFAAKLHPGEDRSIIWQRAIRSAADLRACVVHWSAEDVQEIHGFSLSALLKNQAHPHSRSEMSNKRIQAILKLPLKN